MLSKLQKEFLQSICQTPNSKSFASTFSQYDQKEAAARLSIYQNNFFRSIIDTLMETFPGTTKLIGKEAFEVITKQFIQCSPPNTPVLADYGENLPNFISQHPIAQQVPYITDYLSLEWSLHSAYYEEDAEALTPEQFAETNIETLLKSRLIFHPATKVIVSNYAIFSIHEFLQEENESTLNSDTPESILVTRVHYDIQHYLLNHGTQLFFEHLINNATIEQALNISMESDETFDPTLAISFLIQSQASSKILEAS